MAPLAVLFDATGTSASSTALNTFHQVRYEFDFGDDRGQVWPLSGEAKNVQRGGPIAAHVFDLPGTYTVRVRATDPNGAVSDATVTVTVQSAEAVYSGSKTVCVSPTSNYTGCPSGAARQTVLPTAYANLRVLLHRGESFGTVKLGQLDDNAQVGAYGSGAKPRVDRVSIQEGKPLYNGDQWAEDVTVMDLDIGGGIGHMNSGSRFLFYRNDLVRAGGNNAIMIGGALEYSAVNSGLPRDKFTWPREIFVVENRVVGGTDNKALSFLNFQGSLSRFALLGNDMAKAYEHTVRIFKGYKGVISHNALRGQAYSSGGASIRLVLKLHSGGLGAFNDNYAISGSTWASSQIIVSANLLGDANNNGSWTMSLAPQNDLEAEGLQDMILERNTFARGTYTNTEALIVGRRMTSRENKRLDDGVPNIHNASNRTWPLPQDWMTPIWLLR